MADRYGDFDLRRGDEDNTHRWGGESVPTNEFCGVAVASYSGETCSVAAVTNGPVMRLQRDLITLGFLIRGKVPDGVFDRETEWGVREFQIYAKSESVALQVEATADGSETNPSPVRPQSTNPPYLGTLAAVAVPIGDRYRGPVSGVANAETRRLLSLWCDRCWRCPLVFEAWQVRNDQLASLAQSSLWRRSEPGVGGLRIVAYDFSGKFRAALSAVNPSLDTTDRLAVGSWSSTPYGDGPFSTASHALPESEVTPERLIGDSWGNLAPASRAFFKVLRAISEQESYGYFECGNAYDDGIISTGIFHWTLDSGGLPELLNVLKTDHPAAFQDYFGIYGVDVQRVGNAYRLFLENESGGHDRGDDTGDCDYFRIWPWVHRFAMAQCLCGPLQRSQAKHGINRLLGFRGREVTTLNDGGTPRPATIQELFTSERSVAIILRWHVNWPGATLRLIRAAWALARSRAPQLDWSLHPNGWAAGSLDAYEEALALALADAAAQGNDQIRRSTPLLVDFWGPGWNTRKLQNRWRLPLGSPLLTTRGSFPWDRLPVP